MSESKKNSTKKDRGRKSMLWNFFSVVGDSNTASCDICDHTLSFKSTTNNLRKHIKRKHPNVELEIASTFKSNKPFQGKRMRLKEESFLDAYDNSFISGLKSDPLSSIVNSLNKADSVPPTPVPIIVQEIKSPATKSSQSLHRLKCSKFNTKIMNLFIKDFQPYNMINDAGFRGVVSFLSPSYQLPTKRFISKFAIPELYGKCLNTTRESIKEGDVFCISLETWTTASSESFLSVTAHFVNEQFKLTTVMLECSSITFERTPENIGFEIKRIVSDWGIEEKIQFVISENDQTFQSAVSEILCYEHFCCFAETLNMVVREAIANDAIYKIIEKVSTLVTFFKNNTQLYDKLVSCQKDLGEVNVGLKQISDVRCFRSIYLMLERFVKAEATIKNVLEVTDDDVIVLTDDEWKIVGQMCQILKPFESVIVTMSSEVYCPASMVIPIVNGLRSVCDSLIKKPFVAVVEKAVTDVRNAILTYWANIESSATLSVCTFLDPRFKTLAFSTKETADHTKNVVLSALTNTMDDKGTNELHEQIVEEELTVWHVFDQAVAETQTKPSVPPVKSPDEELTVWSTFDNTVAQSKPKLTATSLAVAEIRRYMEEEILPRKESPLEWWKENKQFYPQLSALARSQLCAVSMSTPCSRIFTKKGLLLTERRNKLNERNTKMLVFLNTNYS